MRWSFYTWKLTCTDGKCVNTFDHVKDTNQRWPIILFENLAKRMGYSRLVRDRTLIGGYFVDPNGDCLICVPFSKTLADYI